MPAISDDVDAKICNSSSSDDEGKL
jgi:hypothetical protein